MEGRRRRADQRGERVLVLGALLLQQLGLRGGAVHQRLLLRQIQPRGHAVLMARCDEIERLALQGQALLHHVDLGIGLAQAVPGGGDLRGQQQADILQVGRGLLLAGGGIGDVAAHAAEQVGFVADIRAHHEVVLHGRHGGAAVRRQRTVGGGAQARAAGRSRHLRQQAGAGHARQRLRLFQVGHRHLQRLVLVQRLLHQPVELRIVEALPPWALGRVVGGLRGAPGGLGLPVGGHVHGRARVGRR